MTPILPPFEKRCLAAATQIADELVRALEQTPRGAPGPLPAPPAAVPRQPLTAILLLTGLFAQPGGAVYRGAAAQKLDHAFARCQHQPPDAPVHYYAGLIQSALLVGRAEGKDHYPEQALALAAALAANHRDARYRPDGLFDGWAAWLLALLYLYLHTGEKQLLTPIDAATAQLLAHAQCHPAGMSWRNLRKDIRPLCSFGHGTAGIAYVFLELGHYLNNEAFRYVAQEAFRYENHRWNSAAGNWPDLRRSITGEGAQAEHLARYRSGKISYFTAPGDDCSLAHGTAGIGLARLRAFQIAGRQQDRADIWMAADKLTAYVAGSPFAGYSLGTGKAGAGLFFLEAFRTLAHPPYLAPAQTAAGEIMEHLAARRESTPGTRTPVLALCGAGYFLLRAAAPDRADLLRTGFAPVAISDQERVHLPALGTGVAAVRKTVLSNAYRHTVALLEEAAPAALGQFLAQERPEGCPERGAFSRFVRGTLPTLAAPARHLVADAARYEQAKVKLAGRIRSLALLHVQEIADYASNLVREGGDQAPLLHQKLVLNPEARLVQSRWPWAGRPAGAPANLHAPPGSYTTLLMPFSNATMFEEPLLANGVILLEFTQPNTLGNVIEKLSAFAAQQDEAGLRLFMEATLSGSRQELLDRLGYLIYSQVTHYLTLRVLTVST